MYWFEFLDFSDGVESVRVQVHTNPSGIGRHSFSGPAKDDF